MKMKAIVLPWMVVLGLLSFALPDAEGFKTPTHGVLNGRAADASFLDGFLKSELLISDGLTFKVKGRTIRSWIADGGAGEDKYFGNETPLGALNRSVHHFHNPLMSWDVAGLDGSCFGSQLRGLASVQWAQTPSQEVLAGESATWADARRLFRDSLILEPEPFRDAALAALFKTLGHQTHLVADLAVPAHARNDIHCTLGAEEFEVWANQKAALDLIRGLASDSILKPASSAFGIPLPPGEGVATVPVARLWDSDQYAGTNPEVTLSPAIGLAEYTSANFFSRDTIFSPGFPFPARTSLELLDPPEIAPKVGELRRYVTKVRDGAVVRHFAVPSALFEYLPDSLKSRQLGLDDRVLFDHANLLLPRAVGYSAALLDYFFRGKLDAKLELVEADRFKLTAINASDDDLGRGTLRLFAEDPTTNTRTPITDIRLDDGTPVSNGEITVEEIARNAALPTVTFRSPISPGRMVAVYTGDLGGERAGQPAGFLGGVIGKVISTPRAEAIVPLDDQRLLRSADGVFPLPTVSAGLEGIQWGDLDNTFVGFVPTEPGGPTPSEVRAFRLARPRGSPNVPLSSDGTVALEPLKTVSFPFGLEVGTTVNVTQTTHYRQTLQTFDTRVLMELDRRAGGGVPVSVESTMPALEDVVNEPVTFTFSIPIVLDREHLVGVPGGARPYQWSVVEVGLDANQRLLAVVEAHLTRLEAPPRIFPILKRNREGQLEESDETALVEPTLPVGCSLLALIDLERAQVLGVTSAPTVALTFRTVAHESRLQRHAIVTVEGVTTEYWEEVLPINVSDPPAYPIVELGPLTLPSTGLGAFDFTGHYRGDLQALVGTSLDIAPGSVDARIVFTLDGVREPMYKAFRQVSPFSNLRGYQTLVGGSFRIRPAVGSTAELLVLFTRPVGIPPDVSEGILARWSPEDSSQTRLAYSQELPPRQYSLFGATSQAAMLSAVDRSSRASTVLVDFASDSVRTVASADLSPDYVLFSPALLYNVGDTHFHTLEGLSESNLPLALAPADRVSAFDGAFHLVVGHPR